MSEETKKKSGKDVENKVNKTEKEREEQLKKIKEEQNKIKEQEDSIHRSIRRLGNFLLTIIVTLIVGTGALLFYLININPDAKTELENLASTSTNTVETKVDLGNIIDSAAQAATIATTTATPDANTVDADAVVKKTQNQDLIVLYDGLILDVSKMDLVSLKYIDATSINKDKYVITYSNYEDFSFRDSTLGVLSDKVYDGLVKINKVGKVAISENYNAIPRTVKVVNSVPTIVADNNPKLESYDLIKTIIVDLDGNGTDEYVLVLANTATGYSKITLFNSQGNKINDLAYIEKSKWESVSREEYHLSISNLEILDVDNDGVMEILVEIPSYEGESRVSIVKYKNGDFTGKTDIECSLLP